MNIPFFSLKPVLDPYIVTLCMTSVPVKRVLSWLQWRETQETSRRLPWQASLLRSMSHCHHRVELSRFIKYFYFYESNGSFVLFCFFCPSDKGWGRCSYLWGSAVSQWGQLPLKHAHSGHWSPHLQQPGIVFSAYYGHLLDVLNTFVLLYNLPHAVANLFDFVLWNKKEDFFFL